MKKCITAIICAGVMMTGFAATDSDVTLAKNTVADASTQAKSAAPAAKVPPNGVLTKKKPEYTLQLNSNPTTGYSWFLVSYPSDLIQVVGHQYVPPKRMIPGAGGVDRWQFKARPKALAAPQVIKIQMMYVRPWEVNDQSPVQSFYLVTD